MFQADGFFMSMAVTFCTRGIDGWHPEPPYQSYSIDHYHSTPGVYQPPFVVPRIGINKYFSNKKSAPGRDFRQMFKIGRLRGGDKILRSIQLASIKEIFLSKVTKGTAKMNEAIARGEGL